MVPMRLYGFTGLMLSGKDHVARSLGMEIIGVADPIYVLCTEWCGTSDKAVPGIRRMLQLIGQWGRGQLNEEYVWTPERALWVSQLRQRTEPLVLAGGESAVMDWPQYGQVADYWVQVLRNRLQARAALASENHRVAVTNCRFANEEELIKQLGGAMVHVACSETTRRIRMAQQGYIPTEQELRDISEQFANTAHQSAQFKVWNDPEATKPDSTWLRPEEFSALAG